ncbi:HlyD family efflux transporter periplasmic adaptor subunit [Hydrotalea sandarakina]|jgi:HlyD family secretion protein|uniref:HlyD family secretion protein n=1 Tax=Hydrotalea sandarakina TaxID=1004304 RepID=A0A2W7REN2_9BACT|nr:HlyD family efflux transporter periplasmic adaptor subunit [Hydrotalea sandarakina]PZX59408.1 HlyD family secretion protein [Hydrotalea sandarakina]
MPIVVNENGDISGLSESFHLRSDEVQEFISRKPIFFIRWGTVLFFIIIIIMVIVCRYIQYPDTVICKARLSSLNAPKEVVTRTEGKLQQLLVNNGDSVKQGDALAYMESIANPKSITLIKANLDSILAYIRQNKSDQIIKFFPNYSSQNYLSDLGEIQQPFQIFMQSFISFKDFISKGFYLRKRSMLQTDLNNVTRLHSILIEQKLLLERDVALSKQTFEANKSLAQSKVISALDYRNEESKLISKQLSLPQIKSAIVSNESQQNDKRKEIAELENQISVQKNTFIQALQSLISQVEQWEFKYVLKSPIDGRVQMAGFYQQNQFIKYGQLLFYIHEKSTQYFAEMFIPQYNFGKVNTQQDVLLKFQAYPYEQFGSVTGKIEYISQTPTDSGYLSKVILPNGLMTNYGKSLQYQFGLFAQAEIITEKMRLLDRFYYNIRKLVNR